MEPLKVPCGQCIGCRLDRSRDWTIRQMHEASLYKESSFITLTYSDDCLPEDMSLDVRHTQLFFKLLRKRIAPQKVRFFLCGEYGDSTRRPHYHVNCFGYFPGDAVSLPGSSRYPLYRSAQVESCWDRGNVWIGRFSVDTASYVAGYVTKKLTGQFATLYDGRKPEFSTQSRRPGIAFDWFEKFKGDVYREGAESYVILKGKKVRPARYYDRLFDQVDAKALESYKDNRIPLDPKVRREFSPERLAVRKAVVVSRTSRSKRKDF